MQATPTLPELNESGKLPNLIIFDVDGTLTVPRTAQLLPGRREFFLRLAQGEARLSEVATTIDTLSDIWPATYISFAFQMNDNRWIPTPARSLTDPRWSHAWRKPAPGMLLQAIADAGVMAAQTLMVGDRDEDAGAAAGCAFMWAKDFFAEVA